MRTPRGQPISAEAVSFNVAFLSAAAMMPVPMHGQHQTSQRPKRQQRHTTSGQTLRRSSSASPPFDHNSNAHRRPDHSRTSTGSQASRSSHETALVADRPAVAAGHQHNYSAANSPTLRTLTPCPTSSIGASSKSTSLSPHQHRHWPPADGPLGVDMNLLAHSAESVSSASGTTSLSSRTAMTSDNQGLGDNLLLSRPFTQRNGRTYLNDTSLPYPLPSDLTELHRQSLRTLLLIQLFGAPVCSPSLTKNPPQRVLEVGCGSGFWSMMCHRYFKEEGYGSIHFTGIDVAPLSPGSTDLTADATQPDRDMRWKFVNHDLRQLPWPVPSGEYDLVMVKDMSLATTNVQHQQFIDEYLRLLRPGGTLEIWESDHLIRMLRPHVPGSATTADDADEQEAASSLGAYVISSNTPLSAPLNHFLVEYNTWLTRALENRDLSAVPCTLIQPILLQESETVTDVKSRRLAIPLSEVRWEREGVGGVVTRDGKQTGEGRVKGQKPERTLTASQIALRKIALLTVAQQVQALEPILREVSGKSQDEWDVWLGKMMSDLMSDSGTSWGECLEVGAWWARKRASDV
ncbi:SAM binding domain-containing protein containing protein [Metarhizium album ARSEF 1941]|uniref:SAM binding domain-containing protein containing protein n=1 Tax=Metarhizium album (strain ARSEF 1941) TaxID=1081103 RepID=A0A0B2WWM8_METAS|nr:SAM binding domain-containing protein containing protein [Metarhizium album ARSEF 1941]KHN97245.1 SAM binding domain-containing protein containing protein [Metarhizium album ARSEF 1941]